MGGFCLFGLVRVFCLCFVCLFSCHSALRNLSLYLYLRIHWLVLVNSFPCSFLLKPGLKKKATGEKKKHTTQQTNKHTKPNNQTKNKQQLNWFSSHHSDGLLLPSSVGWDHYLLVTEFLFNISFSLLSICSLGGTRAQIFGNTIWQFWITLFLQICKLFCQDTPSRTRDHSKWNKNGRTSPTGAGDGLSQS